MLARSAFPLCENHELNVMRERKFLPCSSQDCVLARSSGKTTSVENNVHWAWDRGRWEKTVLFPPIVNKVQNEGTQGVRARYCAEFPPLISIVRCPGRPVIMAWSTLWAEIITLVIQNES